MGTIAYLCKKVRIENYRQENTTRVLGKAFGL